MKHVELMPFISVRFSSHMKARVCGLSRELRLPVSEVIRRAVESQLPVWEGQQTPGVGVDGPNAKA
jgi:hypothetical protein